MRIINSAWLAAVTVAITACAGIAPTSTVLVSVPSTPLPATSVLPIASLAPASSEPTVEPTVEPTTPLPATPMPTMPSTKTPRPTRKPASPSPTAQPTPTPISADLEVSIEASTIPDPFYVNTDYTIRVYISALGTHGVDNAHVKLVAKDEATSYKFDTGPIAITDSYYRDVVVNLPASGPSALILSATVPDGYRETNKANNNTSVDIVVTSL